MSTFDQELQRELSVLDKALESLKSKMKAEMQDDKKDKSEVFSSGIEQYAEIRLNKVLLEEGLNTCLEEHMFIPLAVLNWYITKESEEIANLYIKYDLHLMSKSELMNEIEKHIGNIVDARLGMLRLGKLDA